MHCCPDIFASFHGCFPLASSLAPVRGRLPRPVSAAQIPVSSARSRALPPAGRCVGTVSDRRARQCGARFSSSHRIACVVRLSYRVPATRSRRSGFVVSWIAEAIACISARPRRDEIIALHGNKATSAAVSAFVMAAPSVAGQSIGLVERSC